MQREDRLALSQKERDRLKEIHGVIRGRLKAAEAAAHLGLSRRQVRRLVKRVKRQGDGGVVHGLRGRPSNRKIGTCVRGKAMKLLAGEAYHDFGPTLARSTWPALESRPVARPYALGWWKRVCGEHTGRKWWPSTCGANDGRHSGSWC